MVIVIMTVTQTNSGVGAIIATHKVYESIFCEDMLDKDREWRIRLASSSGWVKRKGQSVHLWVWERERKGGRGMRMSGFYLKSSEIVVCMFNTCFCG